MNKKIALAVEFNKLDLQVEQNSLIDIKRVRMKEIA
jgi:hypothetical protein